MNEWKFTESIEVDWELLKFSNLSCYFTRINLSHSLHKNPGWFPNSYTRVFTALQRLTLQEGLKVSVGRTQESVTNKTKGVYLVTPKAMDFVVSTMKILKVLCMDFKGKCSNIQEWLSQYRNNSNAQTKEWISLAPYLLSVGLIWNDKNGNFSFRLYRNEAE